MRYNTKIISRKLKIKTLFICIMYFALCVLPFDTVSFAEERAGVKTVAVINGDEVMGMLKQPSGLFFDEIKKRLYVADSGNNRLVSFDSEFKYLAELSNENIAIPVSLVRDKQGRFFILDRGKADIVFIDLEKKIVKSFPLTGVPIGKEQFLPGRIAIDKADRLYIIDKLNKRLLVVEQTGVFVREITVKDKSFWGFTDVRVNDKGEVYAIDTLGGVVYVFDDKGAVISKFGSREDKKGVFRFPVSLALDKNGLIYVADQHAGKIFVFDKKGNFQYTIAKPGVKTGELSSPSYIFIDKDGKLYIIDANRVQVFKEERE